MVRLILCLLFLSTSVFAETNTVSSTVVTNNTPPTANSPSVVVNNSDVCKTAVAGAVQTQILGISAGSTVRDMNCEKLKNAKTLYDMGMKVAAVSVMCQDPRIFTAMMNAGTPCPIDGMIGEQAKDAWNNPENESMRPDTQSRGGLNLDPETRTTVIGGAVVLGLLAILLGG